jgi:toxin HigB-1
VRLNGRQFWKARQMLVEAGFHPEMEVWFGPYRVDLFNGVIVSYRDKRTRDLASGKRVKTFSGIERAACLKLDRLEAAVELRDLAAVPGNRLEALKGDRKGQYSIRINDQWRICP